LSDTGRAGCAASSPETGAAICWPAWPTKATDHARNYPADDWLNRVHEFEVAELFEFL
jgi:hypothetical protein